MPQLQENGDVIDDSEIDLLEDIRRYGPPNRRVSDETEYFTLPPKRSTMMNDWRSWRTQINDLMSELIDKKSASKETLTVGVHMKTPNFFKGNMSIHGQRVKDEYGGKAIDENDDQGVRAEKKIIDENFFLFGIPRISLQRRPMLRSSSAPERNVPPALPPRDRRHSIVNTGEARRLGERRRLLSRRMSVASP